MILCDKSKQSFVKTIKEHPQINWSAKVLETLIKSSSRDRLEREYTLNTINHAIEALDDVFSDDALLDEFMRRFHSKWWLVWLDTITQHLRSCYDITKYRIAYSTFFKKNNSSFLTKLIEKRDEWYVEASSTQPEENMLQALTQSQYPELFWIPATAGKINNEVLLNNEIITFWEPYINPNTWDRLQIIIEADERSNRPENEVFRYVNLEKWLVSDQFEYISDMFFDKNNKEYFIGYYIHWYTDRDIAELFKTVASFDEIAPFDLDMIDIFDDDQMDELYLQTANIIFSMIKLSMFRKQTWWYQDYDIDELEDPSIIKELYSDYHLGRIMNSEEKELSIIEKRKFIHTEIFDILQYEENIQYEELFVKFMKFVCAKRAGSIHLRDYKLSQEEQASMYKIINSVMVYTKCFKDIESSGKISLYTLQENWWM